MDHELKVEILRMLRELTETAVLSYTAPDDHSGCNTIYYVDQERLLANIDTALSRECLCQEGLAGPDVCPVHRSEK